MSRRAPFKFQLYVAGDALNSTQAVANLTALCREHLPGRHEIDIVDVFREPQRALAEGILMTPTLVKLAPSPARRIVGTLSQTRLVLEALGLEAIDESTQHDLRQSTKPAGRHEGRAATCAK